MQKWKKDPSLYNCSRDHKNRKMLKYDAYIQNFLSQDPLKDWESIDGCIKLWNFALSKNISGKKVLDAGTKDGQFTQYLNDNGYDCTGIEIDDAYVEYAQSKNRNVIKNNICDMTFENNTFDIVFSHHVLGLCPDYLQAYRELFRVVKPNGYIVTLNDIPGNKKKHYSLIKNVDELNVIMDKCPIHNKIFYNYKTKPKFIVILQKC